MRSRDSSISFCANGQNSSTRLMVIKGEKKREEKCMKTRVILGIVLTLTLIGCSNTTKIASEPPATSTSLDQQEPDMPYTKDDAIAAFKKDKDYSNYEISDYVLVEDDKLPLLKAVISFHDHEANTDSNLAFVYGDTILRVGFATNEVDGVKTYEIADNSQLTYVGDGAVTTSIRKIETNEVIDYKITFSYDESTSTTNFKVVAEKPTK
ncbi:hypothetical protein F7731_09500 [Cytobacillus depressus]|uniref:Uncharacterized protein n=1 Tax=Cytobacillus depressus TaxID=1602942 RepID=A0A6L3V830_9BACI|nr:hypothetical protein [Cytobacillus depressus]KAB2336591.1 hypothetical protein F7731_09500 [Cytobacillus depressus]